MVWKLIDIEMMFLWDAGKSRVRATACLALIFEDEDFAGPRVRQVQYDPRSREIIYLGDSTNLPFDHDEMIRNMTEEEKARVMAAAIRLLR